MIEVCVSYSRTPVRFSFVWIENIIQTMVKSSRIRKGTITVHFTNNSEIKKLNQRYRGVNKPTDVLAFPYHQQNEFGSIMVSVEYVQHYVNDNGGSVTKQVGMLLIHGMLHLLDYEHHSRRDAQVMWKCQDFYAKIFDVERIPFDDFG